MNRILTLCVAVLALSLFAAPAADAKKHKKQKKPFPMLSLLVKKGVLKAADLDGIRAMDKENMECIKPKREAKESIVPCLPKVIEKIKAQLAIFEKAIPEIKQKGLAKRAKKVMKQLTKNLAKVEEKAAAPAAGSGSGSGSEAPAAK